MNPHFIPVGNPERITEGLNKGFKNILKLPAFNGYVINLDQ